MDAREVLPYFALFVLLALPFVLKDVLFEILGILVALVIVVNLIATLRLLRA